MGKNHHLIRTACGIWALMWGLTGLTGPAAAAPMQQGEADPAAAPTEIYYIENGYNYVDGSVDVSQGISADAAGVLAQIERNGVLRVSTDAAGGPAAGADARLAGAIAEAMGVELRLIPLESGRVLPAVMEDQSDLAISAIRFTPGRGLLYTMSQGYYYPSELCPVGVLIREDSEIEDLEDLEGRVLVAQSNSLAETVGARYVEDYLEFQRVPNLQAVFETVQSGGAEAGLLDAATAKAWLKKYPDSGLRLAEGLSFQPDAVYLGYRVAAKKGETELIYFVNGVIAQCIENGNYEAWLQE